MTTTVQAGTILIDNEPRLTESLALKSEPYYGKWSVLTDLDSFALDREIHAAGWNFFFMAGEMKVTFFGAIGATKVKESLTRILRKVKKQHFNCLEITGIVAKRFWGIPYATVSAHSRHIQKSFQLDGANGRQARQRDTEWARR